jgi:sensor histidine kinase YesM
MRSNIYSLFSQNTIRSKVFRFSATLIIFFIIGYLFNQIVVTKATNEFNGIFELNIELQKLENEMNQLEKSLEDYISLKETSSFISYTDHYNIIKNMMLVMDKGISYDDRLQSIHNISSMISEYLVLADITIDYKRARNTEEYLTSFDNVKIMSSMIKNHINTLYSNMIKVNLEKYQNLSDALVRFNMIFFLILILIFLLSGLFILDFTKNILTPIENLSKHAKEISKGNYDITPDTDHYFKEAVILSDTFKDMALNINNYIEELKEKTSVEIKLNNVLIENLRVENQLKISELKALQSQINPHFLFNTLNAGVQLANLEDADRTGEYIYNLSRLFRYNIQSLEKTVTLKDEIRNVKSYYHLMKVRFDDMIEFNFEIANDTLDVLMPPMILQPLIENSIIHGFENKVDKGIVNIKSFRINKIVHVEIIDNGLGINGEKVVSLKERKFSSEHSGGHTTGLGLGNVFGRLDAFFRSDKVMDMESEYGKWTKITLRLGEEDEV